MGSAVLKDTGCERCGSDDQHVWREWTETVLEERVLQCKCRDGEEIAARVAVEIDETYAAWGWLDANGDAQFETGDFELRDRSRDEIERVVECWACFHAATEDQWEVTLSDTECAEVFTRVVCKGCGASTSSRSAWPARSPMRC